MTLKEKRQRDTLARRFFSGKRFLRYRKWIVALIVIVIVLLGLDVIGAIRLKRAAQSATNVVEVKWVGYADGYLGVKLRYPENWRLVRNDGERSVSLYAPDSQYVLSFCLTDNEGVERSCVKGNYRTKPTTQDGSVRLFTVSGPREKVVEKGRSLEYYYPKDPMTIGNGTVFFAASWYINLDKTAAEVANIDGYRPIAEQILATLQQTNE